VPRFFACKAQHRSTEREIEMTDRNDTIRAPLTPDLQETVKKVLALRNLTKTTGFKTSRSVGELLGRLTADELSLVSLELQK
jgi:hypothetical protein